MAVQITHLDAPLGAEVAGIDVSKPVPRADIDAIEAAWRERLVVVVHGQKLSDPQLIAFSKNFGELDPPGPNPHSTRRRNAGEFNGFLKPKLRLFADPLRFAAGALVLSPGFRAALDPDVLAANQIACERITGNFS